MRNFRFPGLLSSLFICLSLWPYNLHSQSAPRGSHQAAPPEKPPISILERLPLQFEENKGQTDRRARFLARGVGYTLLLNEDGLGLNLRSKPGTSSQSISMHLVGAQPASITGREQTATRTNYYLGNDPALWHLDVRSYHSVAYMGVYRGIDLIYHGNGSQLEYDFVVSPGADPAQVRMRFEGLRPSLRGEDLYFQGIEQFSLKALHAFQMLNGEPRRVDATWEVSGDQASIRLGPYDHARELIIDPIFYYGAYIGGSSSDAAVSIVPASQPGYFYVALSTSSPLITEPQPGVETQNPNNSGTETLILGLDDSKAPTPPSPLPKFGSGPPDSYPTPLIGSATYIGGTTGVTKPTAMVADQGFNLYVSGTTDNAANFPQLGTQTCSQSCTGFIAKFTTSLDAAASSATLTLQYSSSLPATPLAMAVDQSGNVYLTGSATKNGAGGTLTIPANDVAFQNLVAGAIGQTPNSHAFLLELDPKGATLFCSYIGGSGSDQGNAIAVSGDSVFIAGQSSSGDFPVTPGAYQGSFGGGEDAFVLGASNLSTSPALFFSTYLGGTGTDSGSSIAVAPSGNIVVVGSTNSSQFPIQNDPVFWAQSWPLVVPDPTTGVPELPMSPPTLVRLPTVVPSGSQDAFVTSLSADGTRLLFTDFLGGVARNATNTSAQAVTVDSAGVIYVTGSSSATVQYETPDQFKFLPNGEFLSGQAIEDLPGGDSVFFQKGFSNVFFSEIDPSGSYLLEATLAGGSGTDQGQALTTSRPLASAGNVYIVGATVANPSLAPTSPGQSKPDLFRNAATSSVDKLVPIPPAKDAASDTTGFFVQEALAGFCSMNLVGQIGTMLTFSGPCVSGTQSGTVFATASIDGSSLATAPVVVAASNNSLVGTANLDLTALGSQTLNIKFGFLPLGAIGGTGGCSNNGDTLSGCSIVTTGGGGGTIFNVTSGKLAVSLSCPGISCTYNGKANTVLAGQPVTLTATVANGVPKTVKWNSSGGMLKGMNPNTSIDFIPPDAGDSVEVRATSVADPSVTAPPIELTIISSAASGPLAFTAKASQMVAGTTYQFFANKPVTWTATAGTINSFGSFTAPNPPPNPQTVTITATTVDSPQASVTTQVTVFPVPVLVVPPTSTLPAGGTVTIPISITSAAGMAAESIGLSCAPAQQPTGVSCVFSPNPVVNAGVTMVNLELFSNTVATSPGYGFPHNRYPLSGSALLVAGTIFFKWRKRSRRGKSLPVTAILASAALLTIAACGTSGSFTAPSHQGHLTGTYTLSITVTGATADNPDYNQTLTTVPLKVMIQ
jgi:hypothetical protein